LVSLPDAELLAVASRRQETADSFGNMFDIPKKFRAYEDLAADPDVDVVYIATPHVIHKANSIICLQNGKAVLCEKVFTVNAAEADEVIKLAKHQKCFLMEAMWTRFLPAITKLRELLLNGVIGDVRMMNASLSHQIKFDAKSRFFDPGLAGGTLLDLGIYPVSLASLVFGPPQKIESIAHLGTTGVDEQEVVLLGFDAGRLAMIFSALRVASPHGATLLGSEGHIDILGALYHPHGLSVVESSGKVHAFDLPFAGNGYQYEADEVMRCVRAGKLESDIMPLAETSTIMQTLDAIRACWQMKYPME
jgi:predicted dehydrogenase